MIRQHLFPDAKREALPLGESHCIKPRAQTTARPSSDLCASLSPETVRRAVITGYWPRPRAQARANFTVRGGTATFEVVTRHVGV